MIDPSGPIHSARSGRSVLGALWLPASLLCSLLSVACGGGGGGSAAARVEASAPAPADQIPAPDALDVALDSPVMVVFDREVDPASLDGSTFHVEDRLGRLPATVSYDPDSRTGILEPEDLLAIGTRYQVRVEASVRALDGRMLDAPIEWSFVTREGVWEQPVGITDPGWSASTPVAAWTPGGDAVAAWTHSDGRAGQIAWSRFDPRTERWDRPQVVAESRLGRSRAPDIATNVRGDVVLSWYQWDSTRYLVWVLPIAGATRGIPAARPLSIELGGSASNPRVAIDAPGNAVVVWYQWDGGTSQVWASRRGAGNPAWEAARRLSDPSQGSAIYPRVVAGPGGVLMAFWCQAPRGRKPPRSHLWAASSETVAGAWTEPSRLDSGKAERVAGVESALARDGSSVEVVWIERRGPRWSVWTRTWRDLGGPGLEGGWSAAVRVTESGREIGELAVAVGPAGAALVVWIERTARGGMVRGCRRSALDERWGPPVTLHDHGSAVRDLAIGFGETGNALAVWSQQVGVDLRCTGRRFSLDDDDWRPLERIGLAEGFSRSTVLLPWRNGGALAIYTQWGGKAQRVRSRMLR